MQTTKIKIPPELESFVKAGKTTFYCEDGEWDVNIRERDESPFKAELPLQSIMIAENGCGDCLFLKRSKDGTVNPKVFVFWHEEDRSEVFAKHVKELTAMGEPPAEPKEISGPKPTMSIDQLDVALADTDFLVRSEAMQLFAKTAFGLEALPVLRKALDNDWVQTVILAAECIGKLGPEAATCAAGQAEASARRVDLPYQLIEAGSKVWSYSLINNCYSSCLDALVKLEVDDDTIVDFVLTHIGLPCEDWLIDSLEALKAVGTPRAVSILKRAADFWLPDLNLKYAKQVKKLVETAEIKKPRK